MALIKFIKRVGDYQVGDFVAPRSRFVKYPITMDILINRIRSLVAKYNIGPAPVGCYRMNPDGVESIKRDMKGKGGIYIWYCHNTGYFYLGSARLFFGKGGRLSTYLMPSRVANKHRYISKDLAHALLLHGYEAFSVIIVQQWDVGMDVDMLLRQEQLWMMLYPTYNRSLKVGSNEATPMLESDRREMSTIVYVYEVVNNALVPDSEQQHFGKKELARTGFTNKDGDKVTISNFDLSPLVKTGALYKDRYLFTVVRLEGNALINWVAPSTDGQRVKGVDTRTSGVFVYKYVSVGHVYTQKDFVKFYSTVDQCRAKYGISKTQFQRVRRTGQECQGLRFSNQKLHTSDA